MRGKVSNRSRFALLIFTLGVPSCASSAAWTLSWGTNVLVDIDVRNDTPFSSMLATSEGITSPDPQVERLLLASASSGLGPAARESREESRDESPRALRWALRRAACWRAGFTAGGGSR